jgi:hypothetical protein
VAVDLDGDSCADLATGNQDPSQSGLSTVSILLSRGDGSFAPAAAFDAGDSLHSMAAADLDGDGDVDLATANWSAAFVLV